MKKILLILCCTCCGILFAQNVPYNVNKKKFPLGVDFRKLMPLKVGNWERFAFHDYLPDQEDGNVYYENGKKEIYVIFGRAVDENDLKMVWQRISEKATEGKEKDVKQKNITSPSTRYLLMQGNDFVYMWTRNLYYFSVETKQKSDADDFMKSFPW